MPLCVTLGSLGGCTRTQFRRQADQESYCLIDSRQSDPRWDLPTQAVEPKPESRMYVGVGPDCGPQPSDDPAARRFMNCPDGYDNSRYYSRIPTNSNSENPAWLDYLPRQENGQMLLTQPLAVDLSLLHSREYQTRFENVYLTALDLSNNRFEFDTQWFGGLGTRFSATGSDFGDQRLLDVTTDRLGLTRNLAGGGQFATSVLNSLFWDFGSSGVRGGSAALVTTFTQPLLRGAFRHVRLENLTQAERNLLYAVRDFARFRRLFYVDISTSYLDLLTQLQAIRNAQANVENLERNLIEYQALVDLGMVSQIQVDQVFQQYQNGRLALLASEQNLLSLQDEFKFQLGLPPWVPLGIDESLLTQFELVNPELVELQNTAQKLYESLQYLPPDRPTKQALLDAFDNYQQLRERVAAVLPEVEQELDRWISRLEQADELELAKDDALDIQQQRAQVARIRPTIVELRVSINDRRAFNQRLRAQLEGYSERREPVEQIDAATNLPLQSSADALGRQTADGFQPGSSRSREESPPELTALQDAVDEQLREEISELYVVQTQTRLFLIEIDPAQIQQQTAITFAHQNRLDLMNSQAEVVDAFRKVEVAADALQSDLSVTGAVAVGSDPSKNNAFRFDSSANRYTVGVQFDGPLNRLNERNAYRAAQISYQQTSRGFVAEKDRVANDVRSILRRLELSRLNFQIARQQLVAATRQVELAQIELRQSSEAESNLTLFLLTALEGVLDAKNNLISNWIEYRLQKMRLFAALELLYLDENGHWINEESGIELLSNFRAVDQEYFPPQWMTDTASDPLGDVLNINDSSALERIGPAFGGQQ